MPNINSSSQVWDSPAVTSKTYCHKVGQRGSREILCEGHGIRISLETFFQDDIHTRWYQFPNACLIYLLEGQAHIQLSDSEKEFSLKAHQGITLPAQQIAQVTLLRPQIKLLVIVCLHQDATAVPFRAQSWSSGTASHRQTANGIRRWQLAQIPGCGVDLEVFPKLSKEHLHYHRSSEQYIFCLSGNVQLVSGDISATLSNNEGILINKRARHLIVNQHSQETQLLSIYSPPPNHDRVLVLQKS